MGLGLGGSQAQGPGGAGVIKERAEQVLGWLMPMETWRLFSTRDSPHLQPSLVAKGAYMKFRLYISPPEMNQWFWICVSAFFTANPGYSEAVGQRTSS